VFADFVFDVATAIVDVDVDVDFLANGCFCCPLIRCGGVAEEAAAVVASFLMASAIVKGDRDGVIVVAVFVGAVIGRGVVDVNGHVQEAPVVVAAMVLLLLVEFLFSTSPSSSSYSS
jgi:hypothetical protein